MPQHSEDEEFTFVLTYRQAEIIVKHLGDGVFKDVCDIIATMKSQYEAHLAIVRQPTPLTADEASITMDEAKTRAANMMTAAREQRIAAKSGLTPAKADHAPLSSPPGPG